jgi:acetyl-CoA carboxylase carboxyltransferase component
MDLVQPRLDGSIPPRPASSPTWTSGSSRPSTPGRQPAVEKQHAKGKLTARERSELLLDEGSFTELDEFARHRSTTFGMEKRRPYGDGVVTGFGTIDDRPVCVFSQDVTVFGGSLGEVYGEKIVKIIDFALKTGCPLIGHERGRRRPHPGGRGLPRACTGRSSAATPTPAASSRRSR